MLRESKDLNFPFFSRHELFKINMIEAASIRNELYSGKQG